MEPRNLCVPCTKTTDERCQLLQHREAINEGLLGAGLELCEDVRQVGGARLAVTQSSACDYPLWAHPDDRDKRAAFKLASDLLTCHSRCFTALETYSGACCTCQVREALSKSPTLKSLTVNLLSRRLEQHGNDADVFALVECLSSLDELVFKVDSDSAYWAGRPVDGLLLARAVRNLTTLDVSGLRLNPQHMEWFVGALTANPTIADLAVGGFFYRAGVHGELFAHYLTRSAASLTKLTLRNASVDEDLVLWRILTGVFCEMTSLEELNLDLTMDYEIFTEVTGHFAEVVVRCPTLRLLQLPRRGELCRLEFQNAYRGPRYDVAQWTRAWLKALQTTSSLHELRLNLPDMDEVLCRTLLQAVDNNKTLTKVVLHEVPLVANYKPSINVAVLSRTIKELSLGDRVHLMDLSVTFWNARNILASTDLCAVNFDNLRIEFRAEHGFEHVKACSEVLFRRGTSTSFNIRCDRMIQAAFETLLDWLANSSTLTHVEIVNDEHINIAHVYCGCADMCDQVLSALARNANVARVRLVGVRVQLKHFDMLWDCAYNHRNLVGISLDPTYCLFYPCINHRNLRTKQFYVTALKQMYENSRHACDSAAVLQKRRLMHGMNIH
ncbi:uncharacterized protein [Dermacentor albipictus]|uniref:uncharacterized protein n=1 Tax=Dermacentor albipictus TaxID=60249 RepID=UPI0038FC2548